MRFPCAAAAIVPLELDGALDDFAAPPVAPRPGRRSPFAVEVDCRFPPGRVSRI